jgi:hypothetical protein
MSRRTPTALAALIALLGSTLLAGCGALPGGSSGDHAQARPTPVTTPGPALYSDVAARMAEEGTATFVFSGIGGGETLSGQGAMRFTDGSFDADVTLTMSETGRVRAVLLPSASYLALPAAKGLPRTKPWMKVAPRPRTRLGRTLTPVVDQLRTSFDPESSLGLLRAARRVEEVGPATVEDVPTTQYHAVLDLRRATAQVDGATKDQFQSMLDAGVTALEYEVWVDTSGLPRRFSADIPTTSGLYSVTGIYRDWGRKVSIAAPKAKQVFDADKLKG